MFNRLLSFYHACSEGQETSKASWLLPGSTEIPPWSQQFCRIPRWSGAHAVAWSGAKSLLHIAVPFTMLFKHLRSAETQKKRSKYLRKNKALHILLESNSVEKGSWWTTGWAWASSECLWPRRPMASWDALNKECPAGQQRWSSLSALP